jgi:hypothetical protein
MKKQIRRITGLAAVASLALAIGAGSAGAVKPEGIPGGKPADPGSKGKGKAKSNAARACKAERAEIGVDAFREKYGTGKNGKNAFGKCVSSKRKQSGGGTDGDDGGDSGTV